MLVTVPLQNQLAEPTTAGRPDEAMGEAAWTEEYLVEMQRRLEAVVREGGGGRYGLGRHALPVQLGDKVGDRLTELS